MPKKFISLFFLLSFFISSCGSESSLQESRSGNIYLASNNSLGSSLWMTDGTAEGTTLVKSFHFDDACYRPYLITTIDNSVLFIGSGTSSGFALCKSDGTSEETKVVTDIDFETPPLDMAELNGMKYFSAYDLELGSGIWKTDGTREGTALVKEFTGPPASESLTPFQGELFFSAADLAMGVEPWVSDGTENGTFLLKDIDMSSGSSNPQSFLATESLLFFTADDGIYGWELWVTDGSSAGTRMVKDINPTESAVPWDLIECNDSIYFLANDGVSGQVDLWKSDGSEDGTNKITNLVDSIVDIECSGENIFMRTVSNIDSTHSIFVSDGTTIGTKPLKDLYPGEKYYLGLERVVGGELYFSVRPTSRAFPDIWKSDGTERGTTLVTNLEAPKYSPEIIKFPDFNHYEVNNSFIFSFGVTLWKTDGSEDGTIMIKNLGEIY